MKFDEDTMDLEELSKYAQIIKTGVIILGGSVLAVLGYKLAKELSGKPSYKNLKLFINEKYPNHTAQLKEI